MLYLITKRFNVVFFILACFFKMTPLLPVELPEEPRQLVVLTSGYCFRTAYKVHVPTSRSPLIVKAYIGRSALITKSLVKSIAANEFTVVLQSRVNGHSIEPKAHCDASGHISIEDLKKRDAKESFPLFKKLLATLAHQYAAQDPDTDKKLDRELNQVYITRKNKRAFMPKNTPHLRIEPLADMDLYSIYTLFPMKPRGHRVYIDTYVAYETNIATGKKVLRGVARFPSNGLGSEPAVKFEMTKHGLRHLESTNMKPPSSIWYKQAKKLLQKSMEKFLKFQKVHEHTFQNEVP